MRLWKFTGACVFGLGAPLLAVYWAMSPSSQMYGTIVTHGPRDQQVVALTFDDGPSVPWTLQIADVLDRYGIKGAFFEVGKNVDAHPAISAEMVARGHLVGNHSYQHRKRDSILQLGYGELDRAEKSIAAATGMCPALYRMPNGFHTPWQLHKVSGSHMTTIGWDVNPNDWKNPAADALARNVIDSARPGSIILLHDGEDTKSITNRSATLAALPTIIEGLQAKGYRFVRLDELLQKPAYLPSCAGLKQVGA